VVHRLTVASPSLQTTNRPWKGHSYCHVPHFKFLGPHPYL